MGSRVEVTELPRCDACGPHMVGGELDFSNAPYVDYICTLSSHFDPREGENSTSLYSPSDIL